MSALSLGQGHLADPVGTHQLLQLGDGLQGDECTTRKARAPNDARDLGHPPLARGLCADTGRHGRLDGVEQPGADGNTHLQLPYPPLASRRWRSAACSSGRTPETPQPAQAARSIGRKELTFFVSERVPRGESGVGRSERLLSPTQRPAPSAPGTPRASGRCSAGCVHRPRPSRGRAPHAGDGPGDDLHERHAGASDATTRGGQGQRPCPSLGWARSSVLAWAKGRPVAITSGVLHL